MACESDFPCAVRYPKGILPRSLPRPLPGKNHVSILGVGSVAENCIKASAILKDDGVDVNAYPVNQVKPFDDYLAGAISRSELVLTVEENSVIGGFGSAVMEFVSENFLKTRVSSLGIPDGFIEQANRDELFKRYSLSPEDIAGRARNLIKEYL